MIRNKKLIKVQDIMPEGFDQYVLIKQSLYTSIRLNYVLLSIMLRAMMETLVFNVFNQPPSYSYNTDNFGGIVSRLTVVSREAKKKQHACASSGPRDHYSELFTRMAALKF